MTRPRRLLLIATMTTLTIAAALAAGSGRATAHLASKRVLTLEAAGKAMAAASDLARSRRTTAVFAVVDEGGNLMAVQRLDGTFAAGANISIGKARTAAIYRVRLNVPGIRP